MRGLFKHELSVILEVVSLESTSSIDSSCHRAAFPQSAEEEAPGRMMGVLMGTPSGVGLEHEAIDVFINCNKEIRSAGENAERREYTYAQLCCFSPAENPKQFVDNTWQKGQGGENHK